MRDIFAGISCRSQLQTYAVFTHNKGSLAETCFTNWICDVRRSSERSLLRPDPGALLLSMLEECIQAWDLSCDFVANLFSLVARVGLVRGRIRNFHHKHDEGMPSGIGDGELEVIERAVVPLCAVRLAVTDSSEVARRRVSRLILNELKVFMPFKPRTSKSCFDTQLSPL
jgi:hypothetical protein